MGKSEAEIYEEFKARAREDYFGSDPRTHPHSTPEYVEWVAEVWKMNNERNKNS